MALRDDDAGAKAEGEGRKELATTWPYFFAATRDRLVIFRGEGAAKGERCKCPFQRPVATNLPGCSAVPEHVFFFAVV